MIWTWPFDSDSELKYSWDQTSVALNAAMAGKKWHSVTLQRAPTEGNTLAVEHASGALCIPVIDHEIHTGSGGSLKFTIPSKSGAQPGFFQDNFNKILGNPSFYVNPASPNGSVIYVQFKLRVNDAMLDTRFQEAKYVWNLFTASAGSTRLECTSDAFTASMQGAQFVISGTGFLKSTYTITQYIGPRTVIVDRSPSPLRAGIGGFAEISQTKLAGGWKVLIHFGNSPTGSSSSGTEWTMNNGYQAGCPTMYGQQGASGPGGQQNSTVQFVRNAFQEITIRMQVIDASNARKSWVTWWLNGVQCANWTAAQAVWRDATDPRGPLGFGQIMLTPYHTRKDPTQVHDTGYVWFDDLMISTDPLPMHGGLPKVPTDLGILFE